MKWMIDQIWKPHKLLILTALLFIDVSLLFFFSKGDPCLHSNIFSEVELRGASGLTGKVQNCKIDMSLRPSNIPLKNMGSQGLSQIQKRIEILESSLKNRFQSYHLIRITIVQGGNSPSLQVSPHQITMSEDLFYSKDHHLERGYIKSWLQQSADVGGLGLFRLESLTHFLMWSLGEEAHSDNQWLSYLTQWPHMITSWPGYCRSPIRDNTLQALCLNSSLQRQAEGFTPFSLGIWFSENLWRTFQVLSIKDQIHFLNHMDRFIYNLSRSKNFSLEPIGISEIEVFALSEAKLWKDCLEQSGFIDWSWNFYSKIESEITSNKASMNQVDLIVKRKMPWKLEELEDLQSLSLEDTRYRIVGENSEGYWFFPWSAPIKKELFNNLRAHQMVWIGCDWPTVQELLEIKNIRKVIVVQDCSQKGSAILYSGLLHRGLQYFSLDNRDLKFIVINLEGLAYLSKKDHRLARMQFKSGPVKDKKVQHFLSARSEWLSAIWNPKYRAYEVSAAIDAVEWFKLPENQWPELVPKTIR